MARVLLLIFIGFLVYLLFRGYARAQLNKARAEEAARTALRGEDMIACARCGVNLPRSEAREAEGRLVCQNNPHCH